MAGRPDLAAELAAVGVSADVEDHPGNRATLTFASVGEITSLAARLRPGGNQRTFTEGLNEGRDMGRVLGHSEGYGAGQIDAVRSLLIARRDGSLDETLTTLANTLGVTLPSTAPPDVVFLPGGGQ